MVVVREETESDKLIAHCKRYSRWGTRCVRWFNSLVNVHRVVKTPECQSWIWNMVASLPEANRKFSRHAGQFSHAFLDQKNSAHPGSDQNPQKLSLGPSLERESCIPVRAVGTNKKFWLQRNVQTPSHRFRSQGIWQDDVCSGSRRQASQREEFMGEATEEEKEADKICELAQSWGIPHPTICVQHTQ